MQMIRIVVAMLWGGLLILGVEVVSGQTYPTKPIRIITTEAGGGGDLAARLIAQGISGRLGQPVVVENRPLFLATELAAKAQPDGYTVLLNGLIVWVQPLLQKVTWDTVRDFSPVTQISTAPLVLVVHPSLPVKSVKELIALAKATPGKINYAASGIGTPGHMSSELFKSMTGVEMVQVSYKGTAAAITALIANEVQVSFGNAVPVAAQLKSGKIRALAVTTSEPSKLFPGLPTVAASGLLGFEADIPSGIIAPAKTPAAIINRLNQEIVRAVNEADVKEKFFNSGVEIVGSTPEQFAARMKADVTRLGKLIKDRGIRAE